MGRATIVANIGEGRYRVQLDYGEQKRLAAVADLDATIVALAEKIATQQGLVAQADAAEAQQRAVVAMRFAAVVAAQPTGPQAPSQEYQAALAAYAEAVRALAKLESEHEPIRRVLQTLKATRSAAQRRRQELSDLVTIVERDAWCVTYTTDGAGEVAVHEIPGELPLIVIAPACRAPIEADGRLLARELMSPEQAFFNVAVLPGWQAFMPTYRWGTIDAIDWEANTCALTLGAASSSAQGLDVNAAGEVFMDVPVTYLACHARAFSVGDRVVVRLDGNEWASPRVIGFLDHPLPCPPQAAAELNLDWCATLDVHFSWVVGETLFATMPGDAHTIVGKPPLRFEVVDGSLPPGFLFDPATSLVVGQAMDAGTWSCRIRCTDAGHSATNQRYAEQQMTLNMRKSYSLAGQGLPTVDHEGAYLDDRWSIQSFGDDSSPGTLAYGVTCAYLPHFTTSQTLFSVYPIATIETQLPGQPLPPCQRAFKSLVLWSATSNADARGNRLWFENTGAPPPSGSVVDGIFGFGCYVAFHDINNWMPPDEPFTYTFRIEYRVLVFVDRSQPPVISDATPWLPDAYPDALAEWSGVAMFRLPTG